jgi:hypothetical protein
MYFHRELLHETYFSILSAEVCIYWQISALLWKCTTALRILRSSGPETGPLSVVRATEELFEWKSSCSGLEIEITTTGILRADHATPLYPQKLALILPTSGDRSVGIVGSRTKATKLLLLLLLLLWKRNLQKCLYIFLIVHLSAKA